MVPKGAYFVTEMSSWDVGTFFIVWVEETGSDWPRVSVCGAEMVWGRFPEMIVGGCKGLFVVVRGNC